MPIVQFVPACLTGQSSHVSREFAGAAVARYGRTLLLDEAEKADSFKRPSKHRASRRQRRTGGIVPDGETPGLYHRQASDIALEQIATETLDAQPFRMVVLQSAAPIACPIGLDRARQCHGSILTVAAGVTHLSELQATARLLRHAGGTVLGVVLFDAPTIRFPFTSRRAAA